MLQHIIENQMLQTNKHLAGPNWLIFKCRVYFMWSIVHIKWQC